MELSVGSNTDADTLTVEPIVTSITANGIIRICTERTAHGAVVGRRLTDDREL